MVLNFAVQNLNTVKHLYLKISHTVSSICRHFFHDSLFYAGFDIDTPDDFGRTCLHAAAAGG